MHTLAITSKLQMTVTEHGTTTDEHKHNRNLYD